MKNIILLFAGALLFTACSAPKYAYHFDHYDYNSGKKQAVASHDITNTQIVAEESPVVLKDQTLEASSVPTPLITAEKKTPAISDSEKKIIADKVAGMSKTERKELKSNLKKYIKSLKKSSDQDAGIKATKAWDHDLKMAAIFGAIGVVLTALGGINTVFWILGVVALVVGVVFLIKWLARQ